MSRKKLALILVLAFIASMVFRPSDRASVPEASRDSRAHSQTDDPPGRAVPYRGIEAASWHEVAPDQGAGTEVAPEYNSTTWDDAEKGIPDEVRERLAKQYVGMDIAVARPRDKQGVVRK